MYQKEKKEIIKYCRMMIDRGLTKGTSGNISTFIREDELMLITPSGVDYYDLKEDDIIVMDLDGGIIDGSKTPSSEYNMHKIFYENRLDINSIVHTHSINTTAVSIIDTKLEPIHYLVAMSGAREVPVTEYKTFGTIDLAKEAYEKMLGKNAVILANHGLLTGAKTLRKAFSIAEDIEFSAEVYLKAKSIGDVKLLSDDEMDKMINKFFNKGC